MLHSLRFRNIGPHREMDIDLGPGVIAVLGPNGSGKTNLLNGIHLLYTGDYRRFGCNKEDIVSFDAPPQSPAYVEGRISHQRYNFTLTRGLAGTKSCLAVDGETAIYGETKVQARLNEILGVPPEITSLAAFKAQGELDDIIRAAPAKRMEILQALCQLSFCEKIVEALGRRLSADREIAATVLGNPDELKENLRKAIEERQTVDNEIARLRPSVMTPEAKALADAIVAANQKWQSLTAERSVLERGIAEAGVTHSQAVYNLDVATKRADAVEAKAKPLTERAAKARIFIASAAAANGQANRRASLVTAVQAAENRVANLANDALTIDLEAIDQAIVTTSEEIDQLSPQFVLAQQLLAKVAAGTAVCPTCGSTDIKQAVIQAKATSDAIGPRLKLLRGELAKLQGLVKKAESDELERQQAQTRLDSAKSALAAVPPIAVPSPERVASADKAIADAAAAEAAARKARSEAERLHGAWEAAQTSLTSQQGRLQAVNELAAKMKVPAPEKVARAVELLAANSVAALRLAGLEGQLRGLSNAVATAQQRLEEHEQSVAKLGRIAKRAEVVARVQAAFHRSALPANVIRGVVHAAVPQMNRWLAVFGDTFSAELAEDLTFDASKTYTGQKHTATLLSGAQKAILALSFWLSVPSPLGLLVLDEPTAFLDARNKAQLAKALQQLAAAADGRQVIVTTHAADLQYAFTQSITLESR